MSSQLKISVIIPMKNEADKIERCLGVVFNQTVNEVIIVDGHSTEWIDAKL